MDHEMQAASERATEFERESLRILMTRVAETRVEPFPLVGLVCNRLGPVEERQTKTRSAGPAREEDAKGASYFLVIERDTSSVFPLPAERVGGPAKDCSAKRLCAAPPPTLPVLGGYPAPGPP